MRISSNRLPTPAFARLFVFVALIARLAGKKNDLGKDRRYGDDEHEDEQAIDGKGIAAQRSFRVQEFFERSGGLLKRVKVPAYQELNHPTTRNT